MEKNKEQKLYQVNGNANDPATKGDIAELAAMVVNNMATKDDLKHLEHRMDEKFATKDDLKIEIDSVKDIQKSILSVVRSIEGRLEDWGDIPQRVANLEDDVLKIKSKLPH